MHHYIDVANEVDIIRLFSTLEKKEAEPARYSVDDRLEFERRRERMLGGEGKQYTVEEVHNFIRSNRNNL